MEKGGFRLPAQVCSQDSEVKVLFQKAIKAKMERTKTRVMDNFEDAVPSWAAWALRPVVSVTHDLLTSRNNYVGDVGEGKASAALRFILPRECVLINDVVLEVEPDEFIQVDHVVVAPAGVFLIETEAWQGAFVCYGGTWRRKTGRSWERCDKSPTWQNKRHQELFRRWKESPAATLNLPQEGAGAIRCTAEGWVYVRLLCDSSRPDR